MIGAKGLLGKSWPDLDMLPLGWLTDPGDKKICRLLFPFKFSRHLFLKGVDKTGC